MPPSQNTGGATPVALRDLAPHCAPAGCPQTSFTGVNVLAPAGREEQMRRWGVTPDYVGGRYAGHGPDCDHRPDDDDTEAADFLQEGGWVIATIVDGGGRSGGLTTHRGVLHPDEYVNEDNLRALVSEHLGFTLAEVRSVYRQGRMSAEGRALRARIDARLLEIEQSGGLMTELGRALGWAVNENGNCRTLDNALARAREVAR